MKSNLKYRLFDSDIYLCYLPQLYLLLRMCLKKIGFIRITTLQAWYYKWLWNNTFKPYNNISNGEA